MQIDQQKLRRDQELLDQRQKLSTSFAPQRDNEEQACIDQSLRN